MRNKIFILKQNIKFYQIIYSLKNKNENNSYLYFDVTLIR